MSDTNEIPEIEPCAESSSALEDAPHDLPEALDAVYRAFLDGCEPLEFSGEWSPWEAPADAVTTSELIDETFADLSGQFSPALLAQSGLFVEREDGLLIPLPSLASPGQTCLAISHPGSSNIVDLLTEQGCVRRRTLPIFAVCQERRTIANLNQYPTIVLSASLVDVLIYRSRGIAAATLPDIEELDGPTVEALALAIKRGTFGTQERRDTRSSGDRANRRATKPARKRPVRVVVALGSIADDFTVTPATQTVATFLRDLAEHYDPVYQDVGIWAPQDSTRRQIKLLRGLYCPERLTAAITNSIAADTRLLGTILKQRRARNRNLATAVHDLNAAFAEPENDYDGSARRDEIDNCRSVVRDRLVDPTLMAAHAADSPIDRADLFDFANTTEILCEQMISIREKLRHPRTHDAAATHAEIAKYLKISSHQLKASKAIRRQCNRILCARQIRPSSPYDFLF